MKRGLDDALAPDMPTGNVWVACACGQWHWGRYGAAGLLLVLRPSGGQPEVLLQHRAAWTDEGGTWALLGGAREARETPEQASLREAHEEAGLVAAGITTGELVVVDHGTWSYTYVLASTGTRPELAAAYEETEALVWVPLDDVATYPLHPHFARAWPALRARL
jgi:8-oxo-dGTP diphosphatase